MLPKIGKVDRLSFDKIILPHLGCPNPKVLIGPRHGVDAAVIELPDKHVMVVAEDPTFGMPAVMPHFGWHIVHVCASDVAVLGIKPQYMTICLMLPPGTQDSVLENIWKEVHGECEKLGISIVGGHTGIYPGIDYPLNGGCTVWGFGDKAQTTPASNARPGDCVIITKGPAIEATAILATQAKSSLSKKIGRKLVNTALERFFQMTVVEDAIIASPFAHAMHDATEGGLLNGVYEVAAASGLGVTIHEDRIPLPDDVASICAAFNIDPLISISEGTLVIAAPPAKSGKLLASLEAAGIQAWNIGEFTSAKRVFRRRNGRSQILKPVAVDPFWDAFFSATGA
jgi:hydrogenase maturation factor